MQNRRQAMTAAEYKERAIRFLENFNHPDPRVFEELITDDFTFAMITTMKEFAPVRGRAAFARIETERLNALFPDGLRMKLGTVICDGPHVAVQAECDTVAMNGRSYVQRYHFYLRFEGDLIAEGLEYNDTSLVREVFLT
jgi:ketosteroid isomerase-like protein